MPARALSRANAPHYAWGGGCDGWHLCAAPGLSVIEERMPPGSAETRHRHGTARQIFYVLDGALDMEIEGEMLRLRPGEALEVPPGAAHQARNATGADTRFLVISVPPAQGDRQPAEARP
jgi:mannose-6-phosphate isomerase-like protein (cupin superfamily)